MNRKPLNLKKLLLTVGAVAGIGIAACLMMCMFGCEQIHISDYLNDHGYDNYDLDREDDEDEA